MMACVVEVATKKMTIEQLEEMLPKKDTKIPVMAPSCGLMLADIKYPDKFAVTEKTTSWFWGSPFLKHLDP
jgi:tRNA U38,U39,U40 pseudouridine synthase TruA